MLKHEIQPLIDDFQRANGRGNISNANQALIRMIQLLVRHLDRQASQQIIPAMMYRNDATPVPTFMETATCSITPTMLGIPAAPSLQAAVETLHAANYVIDPDYTAIKEHLDAPVEPPVKIRKKPGRKPKNRSIVA